MEHQCPVCLEYVEDKIIKHDQPCWSCKINKADNLLRLENAKITDGWYED